MSRRKKWIFALAILIPVALFGAVGWYYLFREVDAHFASEEDHFKYGSVGVEAANGVPYWVWRVLPDLFPEHMPGGSGGYEKFGFIWEAGREAPIGLPVKTIGFKRLGINCALCHTATVRTSADAEPALLMGAPSTTFDLHSYLRFLFACAADERFTADQIIPAIKKIHDLPLFEGVIYRLMLIPAMRDALLKQKNQLYWMERVPPWGPGRADPFNPAKVQILRLPWDGTVGASDIPQLWNWRAREGFSLHADGLNTSLREIMLNSGIGNGASAGSADVAGLDRIQAWVMDLQPPAFPFPVDEALAKRGRAVFEANCSECHAFGGAKTGETIPVRRLGTDRHRLDSWSKASAAAFNGLSEYAWKYGAFRKTTGYKADALDGIWSRAPYLHNGSVPSLADLLRAPEDRPGTFYRGYDVYDSKSVGFVSRGPQAEAAGFLFDTTLRGNKNGGHLWGTDLGASEKQALIEYLKTL